MRPRRAWARVPHFIEKIRPLDTFSVVNSGLGNGVAAIAAGESHACALTDAGGAKSWGRNFEGQLGDGRIVISSRPIPVIDIMQGEHYPVYIPMLVR